MTVANVALYKNNNYNRSYSLIIQNTNEDKTNQKIKLVYIHVPQWQWIDQLNMLTMKRNEQLYSCTRGISSTSKDIILRTTDRAYSTGPTYCTVCCKQQGSKKQQFTGHPDTTSNQTHS